MKSLLFQIIDHFLRVSETRGGELVIATPVGFEPAGIQMNHIAGNFIFTQFGSNVADLFLGVIGATAHP